MRVPLPPLEGAYHPSKLACASRVGHALPKLMCDPGRARAKGEDK
jgi:hypothetical protein